MFALIKYTDSSLEICSVKQITKKKGQECTVKSKGWKYQGFIIATADSKEELETLVANNDAMSSSAATIDLEDYCIGQEDFFKKIGEPQMNKNCPISDNELSMELGCSKFYDISSASLDLDQSNDIRDIQSEEIAQETTNEDILNEEEEEVESSKNDPDYQAEEDGDDISIYEEGFEMNKLGMIPSSSMQMNLKDISDLSVNTSACDDTNMYVQESRGKKGDHKFNFCCFCYTKQLKIARHLQNIHKEEEDVRKFLNLPKQSLERKEIIATIRKRGNFLFNTKEHFNDGELIVSRRPNIKYNRKAIDYKACSKGFFSKGSLRAHASKCLISQDKSHRVIMLYSKRITGRLHKIATDVVRRKLFPPLREDEVVRAIRYDKLIITYANKMAAKYKQERYFEMIRQRLRLLGRFLLSIRALNRQITDLESVFDPKFCDDAHKAIDRQAGLDMDTGDYKVPTVASTLGTLIKQIGNILINESIKEHDDHKRKNAKHFLQLFTQEVHIYVNRTVVESQLQQRRRKRVLLPCMDDIKVFNNYLSSKTNEGLRNLKTEFSMKNWQELVETTLLSLQLFNRKRSGEIERLLVEDFNSRQGIDEQTDKDLFQSLSRKKQMVAKRYVRIAIRGKLNRTVPVLMNSHDIQCVQKILKYRNEAKVAVKNPYVFGRPYSKNQYFRSCILIRKYSKICGARNPERLRGTKLRKHIATACMSLNLQEQEVSDLASFMGHAEKIHKDIYRQPISREILGMSKLLETAQGDKGDSDAEYEEGDGPDPDEISLVAHKVDEQPNMESNSNESTERKIKKRSTSPYGSVKRKRWTNQEKAAVLKHFSKHVKDRKLPSFKDIEKAINENFCLRERSVPQIKTWIHNQFRSSKQ